HELTRGKVVEEEEEDAPEHGGDRKPVAPAGALAQENPSEDGGVNGRRVLQHYRVGRLCKLDRGNEEEHHDRVAEGGPYLAVRPGRPGFSNEEEKDNGGDRAPHTGDAERVPVDPADEEPARAPQDACCDELKISRSDGSFFVSC